MSPVRLAPNTVVADSAVTASTVPSRALPTGTGMRPRPRSSAYRTPMSTLGGAPAAATVRTTDRARPPGGGSGSGRAGRACRIAGQTDSSSTAATTAGTPMSVTSGSTDSAPGSAAASRASPTGVSGDSAAASATAPAAPATPMTNARARPSSTNWRPRSPIADSAS